MLVFSLTQSIYTTMSVKLCSQVCDNVRKNMTKESHSYEKEKNSHTVFDRLVDIENIYRHHRHTIMAIVDFLPTFFDLITVIVFEHDQKLLLNYY